MRILRMHKMLCAFMSVFMIFVLLWLKSRRQQETVQKLRDRLHEKLDLYKSRDVLWEMPFVALKKDPRLFTVDPKHADPLLTFPASLQRARWENQSAMSYTLHKAKTQLVWRSLKHNFRLRVTLPANVTLRQFHWNISQELLLQNQQCEKLNYDDLLVPLIPEMVSTEMLLQFDPPIFGGVWTNEECEARDQVAILIPYRDDQRKSLNIFLPYMHFYLQQQGIDYGLYLIEQVDSRPFNRGKLLNVGFVVSQLMHNYRCVILHEIDRLPDRTGPSYTCQDSDKPVQMVGPIRVSLITNEDMWNTSTKVFKTIRPMDMTDSLMGVTAIHATHFVAVNGMSNSYWGSVREDYDDLYGRLSIKSLTPNSVYEYSTDNQFTVINNPQFGNHTGRSLRIEDIRRDMVHDGLSNLKFNIVNILYRPWYTHIQVLL